MIFWGSDEVGNVTDAEVVEREATDDDVVDDDVDVDDVGVDVEDAEEVTVVAVVEAVGADVRATLRSSSN